MTSRFICVHGHFYQPPREDPLTREIPVESGASPFPNWNERIYAECYRPNAELGNFGRISFNIGPTLCEWMASTHPDTLNAIISQDRENMRLHGVGNAMAQPYHHSILPLASYRDKVTQVSWGIADFEHRFGRKPQGMWLPETAVDLETLCVLTDHGIEYTILAPWQAEAENLDDTQPYRVDLPGGRHMTVFFYHAGVSSGVSFNPDLTVNADHFASRELARQFPPAGTRRKGPRLMLIASDGELYGHHQPLRDHFLQHLLNHASEPAGLKPTFPALWLKSNPPKRTVRIRENTSWSCHHGVERWRGKCECTPGDGQWKYRLREAFNRLAASLDDIYAREAGAFTPDVWKFRDAYIAVLLGQRNPEDLIWEQAGRRLDAEQTARLRKLLEAQYERQRMFASCAWFFEDFDRIEPRNAVAYATQAARLTCQATGVDLSEQLVKNLSKVTSSRTALKGDTVFRRYWR